MEIVRILHSIQERTTHSKHDHSESEAKSRGNNIALLNLYHLFSITTADGPGSEISELNDEEDIVPQSNTAATNTFSSSIALLFFLIIGAKKTTVASISYS